MVTLDNLRQAEINLKNKQTALKERVASPRAMAKDRQLIKVMENQLEKSLKTLNDLETENKNLRKEIDVCRKEQGVQDKVTASYTKEIK